MKDARAPQLEDIRTTLRAVSDDIHTKFHVRSMRVFGSVARGTARAGGDVDILVDFTRTPSLFTIMHLKDEIDAVIGAPVDLVFVEGLRPELRAGILDSAILV